MMVKKVLIIDDEQNIRYLLKEELIERGYDVFECEDTHSIMRKIDQINPHAIILDIKLDDEDNQGGLNALQLIRDKYEHIPIIIHTAYELYKTDKRATLATFYVVKSFEFTKIMETLEKAFEQ